mmetsp:Transcript_14648/g.31912  ORF Transcript_14648/g.31912 Transcript_14648/m.31912 type:complete len:173 (-) Transcript_14648:32-550(-)|eukprot:CAMPEP_0202919928 /NCGR_PEP_ID=MMETSP1392-20130828/76590_1 /ASSEMBLY_ACC=CAM_ASM_000868 /TAXON_ID=225041 /ORGANISM="Chlamydomonas chlamydogama, Strain SAG 11-48b" /LENGTH=172 /DNA_ID=CAMNT_0049613395 /DNA_START=166 /DNA_END=684 /DNA_ORIENTATION=-
MACYWDCDTRANRNVWYLVVFGIFTGMCLLIIGGAGGMHAKGINEFAGSKYNCWEVNSNCKHNRSEVYISAAYHNLLLPTSCYDNSTSKEFSCCYTWADWVCDYETWWALVWAGTGCLVVLGILPMSYFCCCSNPTPDRITPVVQAALMKEVVKGYKMPVGYPVSHPQPREG